MLQSFSSATPFSDLSTVPAEGLPTSPLVAFGISLSLFSPLKGIGGMKWSSSVFPPPEINTYHLPVITQLSWPRKLAPPPATPLCNTSPDHFSKSSSWTSCWPLPYMQLSRQNPFIVFNIINFFLTPCIYLFMYLWEVRGQLEGAGSFLPPYGSQDWTRVIRFGSKHLYFLSHTSTLTLTLTVDGSSSPTCPASLSKPNFLRDF